jgi:hypothetical protein
MAEAKARMERSASVGTDNTSIPDNDLITRLRAQLFDLSMRAKDIESGVGKNHIAAIKVRNQMADLREAIVNEQRRLSGSFGQDYEPARARYDELSATLITHTLAAIMRFRLLMIAAGYEDGNDADTLRGDPMFKMALDLSPSDRDLCSQPTISRLG